MLFPYKITKIAKQNCTNLSILSFTMRLIYLFHHGVKEVDSGTGGTYDVKTSPWEGCKESMESHPTKEMRVLIRRMYKNCPIL